MPKSYARDFRVALSTDRDVNFTYRTRKDATKIRIAAYRFAARNNAKAQTAKVLGSKVVRVKFTTKEAV